MKLPIFLSVALISTLFLDATSSLEVAINERDYKKAISLQKELIASVNLQEKGALSYELALLYLKDQDQEHAFGSFLQALDQSQMTSLYNFCDEKTYKEVLAIYLDVTVPSPQVTAQKLLNRVVPILKDHPEEKIFNYFVAIAYANLGKYDEFFKHFYIAYQAYPDHYFAFKTKAVLHIKLLERTREEKERTIQREAIVRNLREAMKREPNDTTIYKMMIGFSPPALKHESIKIGINKIVDDDIVVPRTDILFYVEEAVDVNEPALAEAFLSRASIWYPSSKIILEAKRKIEK